MQLEWNANYSGVAMASSLMVNTVLITWVQREEKMNEPSSDCNRESCSMKDFLIDNTSKLGTDLSIANMYFDPQHIIQDYEKEVQHH